MVCVGCGFANPDGFKFCGQCGGALADRSGDAEHRQLTVMFCDLVGSTTLSEELDPESLRELVREYQQACADSIEHYEGHIAQYLGDGILAYFGYPRALEDAPRRAIRAALGLRDRLLVLNQTLPRPLAVRAAVHTGLVVVGEMGAGGRRENLALGETPNVAARLQGLAGVNEVVISQATLELVEADFLCADLGDCALKGISHPIRAYRVEGVREERARRALVRSTSGGAPLVGRDSELRQLVQAWEMARAGQGSALLVVGQPGIGKSRLIRAFKEPVIEAGFLVVSLYADAQGRNSAFHPVVEQTRYELRMTEASTARDLERALAEKAPGCSDAETAEVLAVLLGLGSGSGFSPNALRRKIFEAVIRLWVEMSRRAPLLIVLDGADWLDPSTVELLQHLLGVLRGARIQLVVAGRAPAFDLTAARLELSHLDEAAVRALVGVVSGGQLPASMVDAIVSRVDGIPLFAQELTRLTVERFRLQGAAGPEALEVPSRLQDFLMARLDGLPRPAREIAQRAAALGRRFSRELLAGFCGLDSAELDSRLDALVREEVLARLSAEEYVFRHELVREVAYHSLLRRTREEYHQEIARVLVRSFPDLSRRRPELVALHYTEGNLPEQAMPHWKAAGDQALRSSANLEAVEHYRRALHAVPIERAREASAQLLALSEEHGFPLWHAVSEAVLGYLDREVPRLFSAFERLKATGAGLGSTWFLCLLANALAEAGAVDNGLKILEEASAIASLTGEAWYRDGVERARARLLETAGQQTAAG